MLFCKRQFCTNKTIRMFNNNANNNFQIDFKLLPKNCPSLCIPRVFSNIGEARIRKIFEDISIGRIEEIDIIKGNKNNRVFIHLTWNNTPDAQFVRNQVMTGKDVKIIYDEPWFWVVSAARNQPPKPQPQPPQLFKTDEYGRELRQAQPTPLLKPILRRQVCYHEVPPPPPAPLQRQKACFEPPRHVQLRYQEPRQSRQEQQQTDQFGRDIRRPQQPTSVPSPAPAPTAPRPTGPTKTMQSWHLDEYDEDDEEYNLQELQRIKERVQREQQREQQKEQQMQKEQEFVPPPPPPQRFIPQSPTTTPPCLRRKQIQPEEDHQEPEEQEEEQEEEKAPRAPKMDVDEMSKPVVINYGSVLPIKKIRKSRRTVTK